MAIATAIAVAGLAVAAGGAATQYSASKDAKKASAAATAASAASEGLRQKQMVLENRRRQREVIKQGMLARANATSNAAGAGALNSSAFLGGQGQINTQTTQGLVSQAENTQIGQGLFSNNVDRMYAEMRLGNARSDGAMGASLMGLGSSLVTNSGAIASNIQSARSSLFSDSPQTNPYSHVNISYGR